MTFIDGAVPVSSKALLYPKDKSDYLRQYVDELSSLGLIRRNNHSKWSSPTLPIPKGPVFMEFRITVDYTRVNSVVVPIAGAMPDMLKVAA